MDNLPTDRELPSGSVLRNRMLEDGDEKFDVFEERE
jgi:hypothetical protein